MLVAIGSATVPQPAHAVSPGAQRGLGLALSDSAQCWRTPIITPIITPMDITIHRYPRTIRLRLIIRHTASREVLCTVTNTSIPFMGFWVLFKVGRADLSSRNFRSDSRYRLRA